MKMSTSCCSTKSTGPGYATPAEACRAPPETLVYFPCIPVDGSKANYLATVDVDRYSPTYNRVISRAYIPASQTDELHHSGWNTCSSCHGDANAVRKYLVLPSITSAKVFLFDVATDPRAPVLHHTVQSEEVMEKTATNNLHTSHCLADGNIMISGMGDAEGNGKGSFILIDGKTFKVKGTWQAEGDEVPYGYDFWYQPLHNVMVSSEWGAPSSFTKGFNPADVTDKYGRHLHIWEWDSRKYVKSIDLGPNGVIPLEVRFLHDPASTVGFVGCALSSTVFRIFQDRSKEWQAERVISVPAQKVQGWALPEMPALITDILISMDDRFLYFSNWLQGDIRQYDISDTRNPKLVGQVFVSGSLVNDGAVTLTADGGDFQQPEPLYIGDQRVHGGPQMIQLSLDGKRLYVTTSLFSAWDKQFYPDMGKYGSFLLQVDVDNVNGGMTVNKNFGVNMGAEPDGPVFAHEVRYPGGDCTSDIFLYQGKCKL